MPQRIFVGVAWPYANGPQTIGHLAGNLLPADICARYHRLAGREVLMVSGSDMHGTPTTLRAEQEGISPEELACRYHEINRENFERLGLSFDLYTTTHTEVHRRVVQGVFLTLFQNGLLEKRTTEQPYCPRESRFLPDRYLRGTCPYCQSPDARGDECDACSRTLEPAQLLSPRCRLCEGEVEFRPSEHFFFLLPKLSEGLEQYHRRYRDRWKPSVRLFTENFLAQGLRPRAVTRDLAWGVPIPLEGYEKKRIYVWFEAVIGYLSATVEWALRQGRPGAWKEFWDEGQVTRMYNFMGKDNITFHTILWPAILLGIGGLQLPTDVPANEFMVLASSRKISKSRLDAQAPVTLPELLQRYPPDAIRFYAAYHMPQSHDTRFDLEEFLQDHDQILADQWGNLVQRVLTLAQSRYGGQIPSPPPDWSLEGSALAALIRRCHEQMTRELEESHFKEALESALALVRELNRWFHESRPWAVPEAERNRIVYETLFGLRALAVLLSPYLPFTCQRLAEYLGEPQLVSPGHWETALTPPVPGTATKGPEPLFPKLRTRTQAPPTPSADPEASKAPIEGSPPPESRPVSGSVRVPELEIRVARVMEVEVHPQADRLYILTLDVGEGRPRTVLAGLRPFYRPEELRDRSLVLLANMAPRTIRGVTSEGMILAAESGSVVSVLRAPSGVPAGAPVEPGVPHAPRLDAEAFSRIRLFVARVTPLSEGRWRLQIPSESRDVPAPHAPVAPLVVARMDSPPGETAVLRVEGIGCIEPDREVEPGAKVR